jgi:glycine oxidase
VANYDCLVLGGGVIGLSLAYELACQGRQVGLLERGSIGGEASWAGAGIFPPAAAGPHASAEEQLRALSNTLHVQWSRQLLEETGIDNGYRVCGGLYVDRASGGTERLTAQAQQWRSQAINVELLTPAELAELEPALAAGREAGDPVAALCLRDEAQLRNPRHLKALFSACVRRGVTVHEATEAQEFVTRGTRVQAVRTTRGELAAGSFCLTGGTWSGALASRLGCRLEIKPIRGQIALLQTQPGRLHRIVYEGPHYLVPRPDGRILVGSTVEDAGFDKRPTAEAIAGLLAFAVDLVPGLSTATLERTWAGLRPGTADDLPYLGLLPGYDNAFIAAGHFRSGLQLSTATAVVIGQLMRGEAATIDLAAFSPQRTARLNGGGKWQTPPHIRPADHAQSQPAPAN